MHKYVFHHRRRHWGTDNLPIQNADVGQFVDTLSGTCVFVRFVGEREECALGGDLCVPVSKSDGSCDE